MTAEVTLKDLKETVDSILQTLQCQSSKQEDDSLLLHLVAGKVDVQGQRLRSLETEIKYVKDVLAKEFNKPRSIDTDVDKVNISQPVQSSVHVSDQTINALKEEIKQSDKVNTEKIQNFVRQEVRQINELQSQHVDVLKGEIRESKAANGAAVQRIVREELRGSIDLHSRHATDIISRLDKAEQLVFTPMSEMASDIKQTMSSIENLEKGIESIENSLNEYAQTVNEIKGNTILKEEMEVLLKSFGQTSGHQSDHSPQANLKEFLIGRFETLTEANREQISALQKIHDEFGSKGKMNKFISKQNVTLVDQIVSETQILREIIKNNRTERKTYKCDFFVTDFSGLIGSGERQYSRLWFIDGAHNYLKGSATFKIDGTLDIWIVNGCNSRVVGQKVENGPRVKVTVKAVKVGKKNWELGNDVMHVTELNTDSDVDGWTQSFGIDIVSISCQELKDKYYIDESDRVLLRYEITVT